MFYHPTPPSVPHQLSHIPFFFPSPAPFDAFPRHSDFSPVRRFCSSGVERRKRRDGTGRDGMGRDGTGQDRTGQDRSARFRNDDACAAEPGERSATVSPTGLGIFCAGVVFFWLAGAALEASLVWSVPTRRTSGIVFAAACRKACCMADGLQMQITQWVGGTVQHR